MIPCMSDDEVHAEQFFSPQESIAFKSYPVHMQKKAFSMLRTRKEAFLKALGTGLGNIARYQAEKVPNWLFIASTLPQDMRPPLPPGDMMSFSIACNGWATMAEKDVLLMIWAAFFAK